MSILITILITILIFGVIIFIHEFGHFIVAKANGIRVNEFALGMGPAIVKWGGKKKQGADAGEETGTVYAIRPFPIGGYCAMEGEDSASEDTGAFCNKSVPRRIAVVVAGAVMNLVLGFVLCLIIAGSQDVLATKTVSQVSDGTPAQAAGLQVGDEILKYNGHSVVNYSDLVYYVSTETSDEVSMLVRRDGEKILIRNIGFAEFEYEDGSTGRQLGIGLGVKEKTFGGVITDAFGNTIYYVKAVWHALVQLLTGQVGLRQLSGPIGVGEAVGEAMHYGVGAILSLAALITINLGVFNMLPFPALDGGRFVFLLLEAIRRKPIKREVEAYINFAGLAILMLLMVVVAVKDVFHLFQ